MLKVTFKSYVEKKNEPMEDNRMNSVLLDSFDQSQARRLTRI